MLSVCYVIARPSVCLSVTRVDQSKTCEVMIMKYSPYGSPIPLDFAGKFYPEHLTGSPSGGGCQTREVWENKPFYSFKRQYLETIRDTSKLTIND